MSGKNTGIAYERLVQEIYTQILKQENVKNIEVKHNVIIKGKTVNHQIDVYWEFEIAGITYKTIVQAKDWNSTVKLSDILTFATVINDIPGNPHGIYITKTGYQQGAKEYAKAHGITLCELREPSEKDWEGKMRNIELNLHMTIPDYNNLITIIDGEWVLKNKIPVSEIEATSGYINSNTPLYNVNHEEITSIIQIINEYVTAIDDTESHTIKHSFTEPTYIKINHLFLKLNAISFELKLHRSTYVHKIIGDNIVKYILKNTLTEKTRTIGSDLKPITNQLPPT